MRFFLMAILLFGFVMAFSVTPGYIETKDSGDPRLPKLNVGITLDCDDRIITVDVTSNETGDAVDDSLLYLFYTNYGYQLIANGKTGADGIGKMNVTGNRNYLTALFILKAEKSGYRSKEIEFTYQKCFEAPPENTTKNETTVQNDTGENQTKNTTPPVNTTTPNATANTTPKLPPNASNGTGNGAKPIAPPPQAPCLPALVLVMLLAALRID